MQLDYVPLLPVMRDVYSIPRGQAPDFNGLKRFRHYLRTIGDEDGTGLELPPLVIINPMAKDHVKTLVDELLALDADAIAAHAAAEAAARVTDVPCDFKATLVIIDDWMGKWTNRGAYEYDVRFRFGPSPEQRPRWTKHFWITAVLWSSEPASERAVREAMLTAIYRLAYVERHGPARTLRQMLAQEGQVMAMAGCTQPLLDPNDLGYTREVLGPHLEEEGMRIAIECMWRANTSTCRRKRKSASRLFCSAPRDLAFSPRGEKRSKAVFDVWPCLLSCFGDGGFRR